MGIAVLGPLSIDGVTAVLGRRDRLVLSALSVRPGEVLSSEQLADVLWLDEPPATWTKVIQGCVVRLRKLLGPGSIETLPTGYRLSLTHEQIDAQRFERAVEHARALLNGADDADRAAFVLGEALALWRGKAFGDVEEWEPGRIESGRLDELRREAEELYVEATLRTGHSEKVLARAQSLVREQPLRERRWALLALAQYQAGQQNEALATLRRVRIVFNRDLGVDPGPELEQLEQAMLRQDPSLVEQAPLPEPSAVCPYRGLLPYDTDYADTFFGRSASVDACLRHLDATGVLAVVGPSGSGKSSMVRAGVVAALRRDGRDVVVISPGLRPIDAIALLPGRRATSTLVVDQCEEVYSLCQDSAERERFLDVLVEHARSGPLVVVLRADHLVDVASHRGFASVVQRGLYLISAMSEEELRAAIVEPARLARLDVEPALVQILVQEVSGNPGALPMLSHALQETWQRREGRTLTVTGYRSSGGIREAVARSAEEIYSGIPADQQPKLRALLLRLVAPGPEGDPVPRRMPRRLVVTDPAHGQLVDLLVGSRLVTSDDGSVEIAHEALVREWPRLRNWLDEDVEGQRVLHHLATSADSWDSLGRPDSELYRGVRLAKALDWRARTGPTLSSLERDFLENSEHLAQAELRSAEDRARQQTRVNRRLRVVLAVAAVLLMVTSAAGIYAARQTRRAETAAATAQDSAVAEVARRIGAHALLTPDISESLLLAVQGVRLGDSPQTRGNLFAALARRPHLVRSVPLEGDHVGEPEVSADGGRVAISDQNGVVRLYDAATSGLLQSYPLPAASRTTPIAFSPADQYLAVGEEGADRVWMLDPHTLVPSGRPVHVPNVFHTPLVPGGVSPDPTVVTGLDFSGDGRYLAASVQRGGVGALGWRYGVVTWDLRSRSRSWHFVRTHASAQDLVLSPDGRTVYTPSPLSAYDVATGRPQWSSTFESGDADISADGRFLASDIVQDEARSPSPAGIRLIDAATGETLQFLSSREDGLNGIHYAQNGRRLSSRIRFSQDGSQLASLSGSGLLTVWDLTTFDPVVAAATSEDSVGLSLSPDGHRAYTVSGAGMLRTWDLYGDEEFLRRIPAPRRERHIIDVQASPDGTVFAYLWRGQSGGRVRFFNTATGRSVPARVAGRFEQSPWSPSAWHPDGQHYAVVSRSGVVTVLDAATGEQTGRQSVAPGSLRPVPLAYVDGGERLTVGSSRLDQHTGKVAGHMWFVDAETLDPRDLIIQMAGTCCAVGAPQGGLQMVFDDSGDDSGQTWRLLDTKSYGEVLHFGELDLHVTSAAFSPDGARVAVTGFGGEVDIIDVTSGRVTRPPVPGPTADGSWVRWSPDSSRIVSGAADGSVSVWDGASLDLLATTVVPAEVDPVAVSPVFTADEQVLLATYDGRVYQWDTDIKHALEYACQMAGRNLTTVEWEAALPDLPYEETCP